MKSKFLILILQFLLIGCANVNHREATGPIRNGDLTDYDAIKTDNFIRNFLDVEKSYIERKWIIEYKKDNDPSEFGQWYIFDTIWGVKIINIENMDTLNKKMRYQFQGLALEQNYGVISIFVIRPSLQEIK